MNDTIISPAQSLLKNTPLIADHKSEIENLIRCVGRSGDLWPSQWIQLITFVYEFRPDFILELGRGYGNSTCAFNEVCQLMKPDHCEVLSLCISDDWDKHTSPNLHKTVPDGWFSTVTTLKADILTFDFEKALHNKKRVVVFWDAHGFDIAEVILGNILPLLKDRANLIIMHDLSDARYIGDATRFYGDNGLWKGKNTWNGPKIQIGNISSSVEQAIAAIDFCSRNNLVLHSSDESYHTELSETEWKYMVSRMGNDFVSKYGHWFWFSLHETSAELTFPKCTVSDRRFDVHTVKNHLIALKPQSSAHCYPVQKDPGDVQALVSACSFSILFNKSGKDLIDHLDKNFYSGDLNQHPIEITDKRVIVHPTTPEDHLATPFMDLHSSSDGTSHFLKISVELDPEFPLKTHYKIFLQDEDYQQLTENILTDVEVLNKRREEKIEYIYICKNISKVRLIITFEDAVSSYLPASLVIEESVTGNRLKEKIKKIFSK